MKTHTFSIVVGTAACNARCPYCVSKMTQTEACDKADIRWDRFDTACRIAKAAGDGLISVLLTGKGEPMLYNSSIAAYLWRMDHQFPLVDLQTNGVGILKMPFQELKQWAATGLTLVCISVAHYDPAASDCIMGLPSSYNFWQAVDMVHEAGMAVRINCTMVKGGVDSIDNVDRFLTHCKNFQVEQCTIRPVDRPEKALDSEVAKWVDSHRPALKVSELYDHLDSLGTELLRLPHGASVFDYYGQNVCVGNCLTDTTDPNDIRQIIFFPDGRIAYDWKYPGARIL